MRFLTCINYTSHTSAINLHTKLGQKLSNQGTHCEYNTQEEERKTEELQTAVSWLAILHCMQYGCSWNVSSYTDEPVGTSHIP
jgi:hypothetical protein